MHLPSAFRASGDAVVFDVLSVIFIGIHHFTRTSRRTCLRRFGNLLNDCYANQFLVPPPISATYEGLAWLPAPRIVVVLCHV